MLRSVLHPLQIKCKGHLKSSIISTPLHTRMCVFQTFALLILILKLIDLDCCEAANDTVTANFVYQCSATYTPGGGLKNYQLDWKAVGLMICFVLDDQVQLEYYHHTKRLRLNDFVKYLQEEGQWNDTHYEAFHSSVA